MTLRVSTGYLIGRHFMEKFLTFLVALILTLSEITQSPVSRIFDTEITLRFSLRDLIEFRLRQYERLYV